MERQNQEADERAANEAIIEKVEQQAARQRIPGAFDIAFLSGRDDVTELLLVRHGQQTYDTNGPVSEWVDPPLSKLGLNQARLVGMRFSTERIDAVYASPLQRALITGQEIASHHRLELIIVDDLKEVGIFRDIPPEKTPLEAIGRLQLSGTRQRMVMEKSWDVYPFSESSAEFRGRVISAVDTIISNHPGGRVAVVCHGGVVNAYVSHVIGSRFDVLFRPAHTSISIAASADGSVSLLTLAPFTVIRFTAEQLK